MATDSPNTPNLADWNFRQKAEQFAHEGYSIEGLLPIETMVRCTGDVTLLEPVRGSVVALTQSLKRRPGFTVHAVSRAGLVCQSCGADFEEAVDSTAEIYVARDAAELDAWEDEDFESVEATEKTSALELVEDELLLALPYVPRCERCAADDAPRVHEF